jgi:hypothetical protein
MVVYFSTVVRAAPQLRGGEVVKLDWATKQVLARHPIVPDNPAVHDPNPRGSTRGGRGILLIDDEVWVASYHSLLVFDSDLRYRRQVSHPLFANLHELASDGENIWVTSTDLDGAVKIDRSGRGLDAWWPREDPVTAARYGLSPLAFDKDADNRTLHVGISSMAPGHVHLNAVAVANGRPLMALNRFGAVVQLRPTQILVDDRSSSGCHNLVATADGHILVNDTAGRAVRVYDSSGEQIRSIALTCFTPVNRILMRNTLPALGAWLATNGRPARVFHPIFHRFAVARPIFVRGLALTPRGTALVGISPATVLEIDWARGRLIDMFTYSRNRHVCVHGLACRGQTR